MIPLLPEKRPINLENNLENTPQKSWQAHLREAITDVDELWHLLELPEKERAGAYQANTLFPLKVPLGFLARIQKGDINDPLLKQILPFGAETISDPNFSSDPVADLANNPIPGIIHKYHGRVLLIATGACAVHCRYCFRRHFPYNEQTAASAQWQQALDYIKSDTSIHEVILSGGDPLSLSDNKLATLFDALDAIAHIKTIRMHSRQAVVLPERIDQGFINLLTQSRKNIVMVIHANHANEIDAAVAEACKKLKSMGVHLLNQSVLLNGINDNHRSLEALSHTLFAIGVLPYYLNCLDKVSGATHFDVSKSKALQLHKTLKARLPGYLVPKLVKDVAKKLSKTWL